MPMRLPFFRSKKLIGWNEYVSLPNWGIARLRAKIDTGARTSSLHVERIKRLPGRQISFYVVLNSGPLRRKRKVTACYHRKSRVKSSPRVNESRYFVYAHVQLGPYKKRIELNLVDRGDMKFRMILGRTALKDRFVVDVGHACLLNRKGVVD